MVSQNCLPREWIHARAWLSPFAVHLKRSQHCLLAIPPIQKKKSKKKNSDPKKEKNLLPRKGPSLPCQRGSQNVKVSQNMDNMIKQAHCSIPATASVRGFYSQNEYFSAGAEPGGTPLCGCRPTAAFGEQRDSSAERGAPGQKDRA